MRFLVVVVFAISLSGACFGHSSADFNSDGWVDINDLAIFASQWLVVDDSNVIHSADFNLNHAVDFTDFAIFAAQWQSEPVIILAISGTTGVDGVIMSGLPGNPITHDGGLYSAAIPSGWSGMVTPTMAGYSFSPSSVSYTNITADLPNRNFTATQITTVTISGTTDMNGVTMSGLPGNPVSSGGGFYSVVVPYGWSGTVTPILAGYIFNPTGRSYVYVSTDLSAQVYAASQLMNFTISGTTGVDGVTMTGLPGDPITSGGGLYSAIVPYGWSGTVTPTKAGYSFSPASISYTDITADMSGRDFTTTQITAVTISGTTGADGVIMSGLPGNPVTSGGGFYTAVVPYGWNGNITPKKTGFDFSPQSRSYANVVTDQSSQDYTFVLMNADGIVWEDNLAAMSRSLGPREVYNGTLWCNNITRVLGIDVNTGMMKEAGMPTGYISAPIFFGAGLDDLSPGNGFYGTANATYVIKIDGTGIPDTFKWSDNGGQTWSAETVAITGSPQILSNGFAVTFGAITGHSFDDKWTINCAKLANLTMYANKYGVFGIGKSSAYGYDFNIQKSSNGWTNFVQVYRDTQITEQGTVEAMARSLVACDNNNLLFFQYPGCIPKVYGSNDGGDTWRMLFQVSGSTTQGKPIRHFHCATYVPSLGRLYVGTGDDFESAGKAACRILVCDDVNDLFEHPSTWKDRWGLNGINDKPKTGYYAGFNDGDGNIDWKTVDILADNTYAYWGLDGVNPGGTEIYRMRHDNLGVKQSLGKFIGSGWYGCMAGKDSNIPVFTVKPGQRSNGSYAPGSDEYLRIVAIKGDNASVIRKWRRASWDINGNGASTPYGFVSAADVVWMWWQGEQGFQYCGMVGTQDDFARYYEDYPWIAEWDNTNYINNGAFTAGTLGTLGGAVQWDNYVNSQAGSGPTTDASEPGFARSCKVIFPAGNRYAAVKQTVDVATLATLKGNLVTLTFSVKPNDGLPAAPADIGAAIVADNAVPGQIYLPTTSYDGNWHELQVTAYIPANTSSLNIRLRANYSGRCPTSNWAYFSDVRLAKGAVPRPKTFP